MPIGQPKECRGAVEMMMNATRIHRLLDEACRLLEADDEHAIAAFVGQGKAMLESRYPIVMPSGDGGERE